MNDIAYCVNKDCPKKESCIRYKCYVSAPNLDNKNAVGMVSVIQGCKEYSLYWKK